MGVDIDRDAMRAAYAARDREAFAQVLAPLGIDLTFDRLEALIDRVPDSEGVAAVIEVIVQALGDEHGIGMVLAHTKLIALARRDGAELLVGLARADQRKYGFAEITRWSGDPQRNRAAMGRWAAAPARAKDSIRISIVALAEPADHVAELLAAVVADPTDDAARLVLADHLIEHGDSRGELIQTHCALYATPALRTSPLRSRFVQLYQRCKAGFRREVAGADHVIRRGLIDEVALTVPALAKLRKTLFATHPIQTLVVKVLTDAHLAKLATLVPSLPATVTKLVIDASNGYNVSHLDIAMPVLAPLYARGGALTFKGISARDEKWEAALAMVRTRELAIVSCNFTRKLYELLADPRSVPELAHLTLALAGNPTPTPALHEFLVAIGARLASLDFTLSFLEGFDTRAIVRGLFERASFTTFATTHPWPNLLVEPLLELERARQLRVIRAIVDAPLLAKLATRLPSLVEIDARLPAGMSAEEIDLVADALARSKIERVYVRGGGEYSEDAIPWALAERVPHVAFLARWYDGSVVLAERSTVFFDEV